MCRYLLVFLCATLSMALSSCTSGTTGSDDGENIPFRQTTGYYFVHTNYPITHTPTFFIFRRYSAFDSLFSWASIDNDKDSEIVDASDLQTNFLIDILVPGEFSIHFEIEKVVQSSGILSVYYTKSTPVPHPGYTTNNHDLFLVSRCSFDSVLIYENKQLLTDPFIEWR